MCSEVRANGQRAQMGLPAFWSVDVNRLAQGILGVAGVAIADYLMAALQNPVIAAMTQRVGAHS